MVVCLFIQYPPIFKEKSMKNQSIAQLKNALRSFHSDEEGLGTLEIVMILAIAAMVVAIIMIFAKDIKNWAQGLIKTMVGKKTID